MHFQFMDTLSQFLLTHPERGLWITFCIAFVESLPLLGTIFPGALFMTVIGMLAGRGLIGFVPMILVSSLGAFLGDLIGFWLGRAFHDKLPHWRVFRKRQHWLKKGQVFFEKHGRKGVFIGRFVGPIRSSVPMIAGLLQMPWKRFIPVVILAAVAWSLVYLIPGVLIGAISLQLTTPQVTLFLASALAVVALLWVLFWLCQRFFSYLCDLGNRLISSLWFACQRVYGARWLIRVITNTENKQDYHQLTRVLIAFFLLCCVLLFTFNVFLGGPLTGLNHPIFYLFQSIHKAMLTHIMFAVTMLGDKHTIVLAFVLIMAVLLWCHEWRQAKYFVVTMVVVFAAVTLFKLGFYEPRPMGLADPAKSSSFPSGHTTLSTVFYGLLAYWTAQQLPARWRSWVTVITVVLLLWVGVSRLYLGAHWLLDVMSGWCLGSAILLLAITFFRRKPKQRGCRFSIWLPCILLSIVVAWSVVTWQTGARLLAGFQPIWSTEIITQQEWLSQPSNPLPIYRPNRVGKASEPMNVQWAAPLRCVSASLLYQDWEVVTQVSSVKKMLTRFTSKKAEDHLFLFRRLFRQREPVIYMMKHLPGTESLAVLRLWVSGVSLKNGLPIWLGTVTLRSPKMHLLSFRSPLDDGASALAMLAPFEQQGYETYSRVIPKKERPERLRQKGWEGQVMLLLSANQDALTCS